MRKSKRYLIGILAWLMLFGSTTSAYGSTAIIIAREGIVREDPNFESDIKKVIDLGQELKISEMQEDWLRVEYEEDSEIITGWIYKDLVISDYNKKELKVGTITTNLLNVRSGPTTGDTIIGQLRKGDQVPVVGDKDIWQQIVLNNGIKGWIHGSFVDISKESNYARGQVITKSELKETNSEKSKTLITLREGMNISIKEIKDKWFHIIVEGKEGWVHSDNVEITINIFNPVNRSGNRVPALHNVGMISSKYIGRPYRYGSTGPSSFDCSGFVTYIFNQYYLDYLKERQIQLPRSSRDMANIGINVSKSELKPGDLVFFNNGRNRTINHVGIYIGDDKFIHSAYSGRRGIVISSLNEPIYIRTYSKAIRI